MNSSLTEVLDAAIDLVVPDNRLAVAARRVGATTETETWVTEGIDIISDHGYSGQIWPNYVDLELLVVLRRCLVVQEKKPIVQDRIERQLDELGGAPYGLLRDLNALDDSWPCELPARIRYKHLRTILRSKLGEGFQVTKMPKIVFAGPDGVTSLESRFEALFPGDPDRVVKFDIFQPLSMPGFAAVAKLAAELTLALESDLDRSANL